MITHPSDEYLTIKSSGRFKIKIEGSIFIATAFPAESEEEAQNSIKKISKEFFDATHNCFAFRIKNTDGETERCNDAGEPNGTAGVPILTAIKSEDLYNVVVVVTRYFGGVKLGTGGLSRAYRRSAQSVLKETEKITKLITREIKLSYPPSMTGKVNQTFGRFGIRVKEQGYEEVPTSKIEVRISILEKVKKALVEATNGQVKFE
jgi:uncharacterized YigZ family protein